MSNSNKSLTNLNSGITWTMLLEAATGLITTIGVSQKCRSNANASKPDDKRTVVADKNFDMALSGMGVLSGGVLVGVAGLFMQHFTTMGKSWISTEKTIVPTVGVLASISYIALGSYLYKAKCDAASGYAVSTIASGSIGLLIIAVIGIMGMMKKDNSPSAQFGF